MKNIIRKLVVRAALRRHYESNMVRRHDWITACKMQIADMLDSGFTDEAIEEHMKSIDKIGFYFAEAHKYGFMGAGVCRNTSLIDLALLWAFPKYIPDCFK